MASFSTTTVNGGDAAKVADGNADNLPATTTRSLPSYSPPDYSNALNPMMSVRRSCEMVESMSRHVMSVYFCDGCLEFLFLADGRFRV